MEEEVVNEKVENVTSQVSEIANETTPNIVEQQMPVNEEVKPIKITKKRPVKAIVLSLVVIAILIGCAFGVLAFLNSPKIIFARTMAKANSKMEKLINENYHDINDGFAMNGSLKFDSNLLGSLKNLSLDFDGKVDVPNNNIEASVNYKENDKSIISGNVYIVDKKAYVESKDIYDKLLFIDELGDEFDLKEIYSKLTKQDLLYVNKSLWNISKNALSKADFKRESINMAFEGKEVKMIANVLEINKNNYAAVETAFIDGIKNDDKLLDIISGLIGMDKKELISSLEGGNNGDYQDYDFNMQFVIYTTPIIPKVVGFEFAEGDYGNDTPYLRYINHKGTIQLKYDEIDLNLKKEKDKYKASLKSYDEELLSGELTLKEDQLAYKDDNISLEVNTENKKNNVSSNIAFNYSLDNNKYINFKLESNYEYGPAKVDIDTSKAKNINSLTEKEQEKIMKNAEKALGKSELYQSFYGQYESAYGQVESVEPDYKSY